MPEPTTTKARTHLDVRIDVLDDAIGAVRRLGGSGSTEVHHYDEGTVAVMADPEGNELCVVALVPGTSLA